MFFYQNCNYDIDQKFIIEETIHFSLTEDPTKFFVKALLPKTVNRLSSNIDSHGGLITQLYHKKDYFDFPIVNFPFMCSTILDAPAIGMYISNAAELLTLPEDRNPS